MRSFLQASIDGLLTGALYALIGMGLALIFGVMRIVNFAHGAFLMLGMYACWLLFDRFQLNPYIGFIPTGLLLFASGFLVYQLLIRPIRNRSDFMQILMTTGISLILVDGVQLKFGADYHQTNIELVNKTLRLGSFTLNAAALLSFAIAGVLIIGLQQFVVRSRTGQALRAIAQNPSVAPLMGINLTRIQGFSFALGIMMAGIAGALLLPALYLFPSVGDDYTLKAFVIVVLGGMGSIEGAAIGGLVLGVAESITSLYLGNQWALAVDFMLFLVVLSLKPSGIFGRQRA
ncbi:MAG TPA: branched-chain amino acid ABC transporter permease [Candidatus Angelobacter sp.]|nr:branched-chain amino acid ABC transporter permease [Candidatus Angelobacter sp.]